MQELTQSIKGCRCFLFRKSGEIVSETADEGVEAARKAGHTVEVSGEHLRSARTSRNVGLAQLARAIGVSKGHLSLVERGERDITPSLLSKYEQALGPIPAVTKQHETVELDDVHRRSFLNVIAAASMGALGLDASAEAARQSARLPHPTRVGLADVEAVEAAAALLMTLDLARGGTSATAFANSALASSAKLLRLPMSDALKQRLHSAVGLLADRIGWTLYDNGLPQEGGKMLMLGLDNASQGGDRDLRAHVLLDLSSLHADMGQPRDAVEILRLALGDERISSAERANLHAVAARHSAAADDKPAGMRHVEMAREALAHPRPALAPDWAQRITLSPGHHDSALGLALYALGEHDQAERHLSAALSTLTAGRTRTTLRCRTRLAILSARAGDEQRAEAHIQRVIVDAANV
jgi:transcriptional regulator with XRE-family HTH domain